MTDYFQRFKDLKAKDEKIIEIEKQPLIRRIFYREPFIYLDNEKKFRLGTEPRMLRALEKDNEGIIYAISPHCVYRFTLKDEIMTPTHSANIDIEVTDIHPVAAGNNSTVIMCGKKWPDSGFRQHCGVRLLDLDNSNNIEILTREPTKKIDGKQLLLTPDDNKIWLSVYEVHTHPSSSVSGSTLEYIECLNDNLTARGIDIEKTIELWKNLKGWRR